MTFQRKPPGQRAAIHSLQQAVARLWAALVDAIPVADTSGYTVDTTTYPNTATGAGNLTTAVFSESTVAFAIALEGDDYPRWLFMADATQGVYMGNGTMDPYTDGFNIFYDGGTGATAAFAMAPSVGTGPGGGSGFVVNQASSRTNTPTQVEVDGPLLLQRGGALLTSFNGNPNGHAPGDLNNLCINGAGTTGSLIYKCTTAGNAASAVWTAIL